MYVDLYGDGTTLLRDRLREVRFHEILDEGSPSLTKGGSLVIDHCEVGAGMLRIAEMIHRDPSHRSTGKAPEGHVCIVIRSGEGLVAEGEETAGERINVIWLLFASQWNTSDNRRLGKR